MTDMGWHPFDAGRTLGQSGSEDGIILLDEEHSDGARITLERDCRNIPFAITCGIYGWMVHTRYFPTEELARQAYKEMKLELVNILQIIPYEDDPELWTKIDGVVSATHDFVQRFP
jgi:hypothetical protein